ncbi:TPA: hypothetical protein ACGZOG_004809 [Klebsiella pneumoniae]|jgi:hypothetical protein|uniref:hypothetical protein n=1 Tax=Enterobacteriaceae TaxID=543 RepID=UPI0007CA07D3|nr:MULTISPECIES: hypothetical protein [Enterobacteriaceae]HCQ8112985.1 hypothetical protein [Klebsiella quasipneumoniae subsp. similipneumoniae]HDT6599833.1 hypothetical protein [Raoultella ornithinolytica]HEJ8141507.1 hypothetical protein [Klebsiella oxytoca]EKX2854909.1 hypothetical protein [Klebsiella pneumoniae]EKY0716983.1 hypothetical protein [Klebsiella pneumoniae]
MNNWLIGMSVDVDDVEMMVNFIVCAPDLEHAETGIQAMGRTWWPALSRENDGHRWQYPQGVVWFNSIILLDDVENSILRGLKFLDAWVISGTASAPVITDEYGNDWRDITR